MTTMTTITVGPDELLKFIEGMNIPVNVLPTDPKCLFRNVEEAEMWRHIINTIQPAHKNKHIRKQILRNKVVKYESGGNEPKEITDWRRSNDLDNKLQNLKNELLISAENLQEKINKTKNIEVQHDEFTKKNESLLIKKEVYNKKKVEITREIDMLKNYQNLFSIFTNKNVPLTKSLEENLNILSDKIKETIGKKNQCDDLTNVLENILFNASRKDLWESLYTHINEIANKLIYLKDNINHDDDERVVSNIGTRIQVSIVKLSEKHIKLNLEVAKNSCYIKQHKEKYISYLNSLKEADVEDEEIQNLDLLFQNEFLLIKKEMYKNKINKLNLVGNNLIYETKNLELLESIKEFDANMKITIQNIEQYDCILANTPQRIIDVLHKNYEIIQRFEFYLKNNPEINISFKDELKELDMFGSMGLLQTPSLILDNNKTVLDHSIYHCNSNNYSNLLGWESIPKLALKLLSILKDYLFYKNKNKCIFDKNIPFIQKELIDYGNYDNKIKNIEKIQSNIHHKVKVVQQLIEFWDQNKLKNYISPDRIVDGKPYKYYEDLLLEYKKLL